jgi:hypothetical protein
MNCPDGFWCFQIKDLINTLILIATIFAIYYGPIRAVKIAKENGDKEERLKRKYSIFSNLMKTRRVILDPLHVASLNLVELEFYEDNSAIAAYRAYIEYLNKSIPTNATTEQTDRFFGDRDDLLFDLIHAIGRNLGYSYDKRDLRKFSYSPQGWQNLETEQQSFRRLMLELLNGQRGLPIRNFAAGDVNPKFPPPPN